MLQDAARRPRAWPASAAKDVGMGRRGIDWGPFRLAGLRMAALGGRVRRQDGAGIAVAMAQGARQVRHCATLQPCNGVAGHGAMPESRIGQTLVGDEFAVCRPRVCLRPAPIAMPGQRGLLRRRANREAARMARSELAC